MFQSLLNALKSFLNVIMNMLGFGFHPVRKNPELQVYVKTNFGKQVSVFLQPSWTVEKIKENLADELGIKKEDLRIIFAGKELPNELIISSCDLGNQSVLHAVKVISKEKPKTLQNISSTENHITEMGNISTFKNEGIVTLNNSKEDAATLESTTQQQTKVHLLCDTSTVITIQLSEAEQEQLKQIKAIEDSREQPHFYVFCGKPCDSIKVGKLRVRCAKCKFGAVTVHRDPHNWQDVLLPNQINATCEENECDGDFAEFYFKCRDHTTLGDDDTAVPLYLMRTNLHLIPCLSCSEVSSPIIVFQCTSAHTLCLDCFVTYCLSRLNERHFVSDTTTGYSLRCPIGCPDSLIKEIHHFKLMGEHHYERYQRFGAEECVLAAGGVLCPKPGCGQGILPDEDCRRVVCVGECGYIFCKDCLQGYHIGQCQADVHGYYGSTDEASGFYSADLLKSSNWDEASKITIQVHTKPCPQCRTPTERDGGCMHMVCTRATCQFNWCWVCQTEWTRECMSAHWFG